MTSSAALFVFDCQSYCTSQQQQQQQRGEGKAIAVHWKVTVEAYLWNTLHSWVFDAEVFIDIPVTDGNTSFTLRECRHFRVPNWPLYRGNIDQILPSDKTTVSPCSENTMRRPNVKTKRYNDLSQKHVFYVMFVFEKDQFCVSFCWPSRCEDSEDYLAQLPAVCTDDNGCLCRRCALDTKFTWREEKVASLMVFFLFFFVSKQNNCIVLTWPDNDDGSLKSKNYTNCFFAYCLRKARCANSVHTVLSYLS